MKMTGKAKCTPIDSIEKIVLSGTVQWISLRTENSDNPLILFLHGGPGTAQISFSRKSQKPLEKDFIVVNWDQRGAGKSYDKNIKKEEMTIDRFILDAEELIMCLLSRFNQEKVFLAGHSWGSIIGIKLAAKRPDLIRAYIGIGQIVDMDRGETVSYNFTLNEAIRRNHKKAERDLRKIGPPPYAHPQDAGVQRKWLSKFNGSTYRGSIIGTILKNLTLSDTSPADLVKFVRGAIFSLTCLEEEQTQVNIKVEIGQLFVPVYFCCGRRDYNVPFELVVEYFNTLVAPEKEMVWFERSAHLLNFEQPDEFCSFCSGLRKRYKLMKT